MAKPEKAPEPAVVPNEELPENMDERREVVARRNAEADKEKS